MIDFFVDGDPVGKARPRFSRLNGRTYTPKKTVAYEQRVRKAYLDACKGAAAYEMNAPILMTINAWFAIPKSASKVKRDRMIRGEIFPTKKPDIDNIIKVIADALNGIAYHDDSQIVRVHLQKAYADRPCVRVCLMEVDEIDP